MNIITWIKNKILRKEVKPYQLPPQYGWRADSEQLFCIPCYPSHTVPFLGFDLEDDNIKNFMKKHKDCKPVELC